MHGFTPQQDINYVKLPDDAAAIPTRLALQIYSRGVQLDAVHEPHYWRTLRPKLYFNKLHFSPHSKAPYFCSFKSNKFASVCYRPALFSKSFKISFRSVSFAAILLKYYTECHRRNGPNFGRVFLMLNYTDITQNTYIQSWTVTEIMAREVWNFDSCYSLIDYKLHVETGRNVWFL